MELDTTNSSDGNNNNNDNNNDNNNSINNNSNNCRKREQEVVKPNKENVKPVDDLEQEDEEEDDGDDYGKSKKRGKRTRKRTKKNKQRVLQESVTKTTDGGGSDDQEVAVAPAAVKTAIKTVTTADKNPPRSAVLSVRTESRHAAVVPPTAVTERSSRHRPPIPDGYVSERSNLHFSDDEVWSMLNHYVLNENQMYMFGYPYVTCNHGFIYYRQTSPQKRLNPVAKEFILKDSANRRSNPQPPSSVTESSSLQQQQQQQRRASDSDGVDAAASQQQRQRQRQRHLHVPQQQYIECLYQNYLLYDLGQRHQMQYLSQRHQLQQQLHQQIEIKMHQQKQLDQQQQQKQQPQKPKDPLTVSCVRCSSLFSVYEELNMSQPGRCLYHYDKLYYDQRTGTRVYACCGGSPTSQGCAKASCHVWTGFLEGKYGPIIGFVDTKNNDVFRATASNRRRVYGMDCEMCYTVAGLEVTRVSLVDLHGAMVYDSLVKTTTPIVDYNTRYSGLSEVDFQKYSSKTLKQVQHDLLRFVSGDSILVGHGLGTDLLMLHMLHMRVVDTCQMFPHHFGYPFRLSLKGLASKLLKRKIQHTYGHDSEEDARAALDLALYKVRRDWEYWNGDWRFCRPNAASYSFVTAISARRA